MEVKLAKHDKLYNKSPTVKKDADGKPGVHKPSHATGEDIQTEGNPVPGAGDGMPIQEKQLHEMHERHHKEVKSMHERHGSEQTDMHKRHQDEHKKHAENHGSLAGTEGGNVQKDKKD